MLNNPVMFEIGIIPNANISKLKSNQKMKIYKSAGEEFENEKKTRYRFYAKSLIHSSLISLTSSNCRSVFRTLSNTPS